jgi:hypothetical protein
MNLQGGFIGMPIAAPLPETYSGTARRSILRRQPNECQGRALEKLGHAVEYLVDSRMALIDEPATKADTEALDILMRLSRCVFFECAEIVPVGRRLMAWVAGVTGGRKD